MTRRALPRVLVAVAVLATAATAIGALDAGSSGRHHRPELELAGSDRALKVDNSRRGRAVLMASNLAPGAVRRGRVSVSVESRAWVTVTADRLGLTRGPNGGLLADALSVRISHIGGGTGRYQLVYQGPLTSLGRHSLGRWRPAENHRFRVRMRFAASPYSQDSLQGARTSFRLLWTATD